MKEIGLKTRLKPAIEMLLGGYNPIILTSKALYVLDASQAENGWFSYTKFVDDEAVYTVQSQFSFKDDIEQFIKKGEGGLYNFMEPHITEIPEIYSPEEPTKPCCC